MAIISEKIIDLLNYRIQEEEKSSRLYKAMGVWLEKNGFLGAAKLWYRYSEEEIDHAQWAYRYLLDVNVQPATLALEQPQNHFKSLPNVIALSYQHEIEVTEQCTKLVKAACDEGDFMTMTFAQRYLKEQVEELSKLQNWIDRLKAFGDNDVALRLLDKEMNRVYSYDQQL